ncbi:Hypothetical protein SRAE_0000077700 [Strongyloides ratti]|uniref:Uncharacterized protein n=1 Tax=Strongyloides ratti TaxID=34506 RepID=A0A090MTM4_STRRB|nr:Hypothetical protein SRAE_0000077700 [Strongyloides ratti]CEF61663.1 Hypothetical protein SRAE_0000077700 [Strongyloides ratti]
MYYFKLTIFATILLISLHFSKGFQLKDYKARNLVFSNEKLMRFRRDDETTEPASTTQTAINGVPYSNGSSESVTTAQSSTETATPASITTDNTTVPEGTTTSQNATQVIVTTTTRAPSILEAAVGSVFSFLSSLFG